MWLKLHAAMILGLMPAEDAGLFLVDLMQRLDAEQDDDMQDWLASCWPALFANKPASLTGKLRDLALDRSMHWYMRSMAMDVVVAAGERAGPEALDAELAWVAGTLAGEAGEDFDMRLIAADLLLDHPRAAHRALLEQLAAEQRARDVDLHFGAQDIDAGYAAARDTPPWREFADPWQFYESEAIVDRQLRWAEEEEAFAGDAQVPYLREGPKIGRNDPCPCGSGKKYKKCCLGLQG